MNDRCGWCGLRALYDDHVDVVSGLCTECGRLLEGLDWRKLLNHGANTAKAPAAPPDSRTSREKRRAWLIMATVEAGGTGILTANAQLLRQLSRREVYESHRFGGRA
jgi:hypothetical protein